VGSWEDNFGKWVHYKAHTTGDFRWECACGHDIKISVRIEKEYGARIAVVHRSAKRQFTTADPSARELVARVEMVTQFAHCGWSLGQWGWDIRDGRGSL
jgi:hypothetical protein